jgi:hypothetical protein
LAFQLVKPTDAIGGRLSGLGGIGGYSVEDDSLALQLGRKGSLLRQKPVHVPLQAPNPADGGGAGRQAIQKRATRPGPSRKAATVCHGATA